MLANPEIRPITIEDYIQIIKKRSRILTASLIIIPSIMTIYVFTMRPIYRSTVSLLIEKATPKVTKFEEVSPRGRDYYLRDMQYYQTQYKILSSRALAEQVFDNLRLSKDQDFQRVRDPIRLLHAKVKIEPVRNSQMVLVHVDDTEPLRAASIANGLAKAYIEQDIENRGRTAREAAGWLESQLGGIKDRLSAAEGALNEYVQANKIVAVPDIEKKTETVLENMKKENGRIETEIAESHKRYKEKHPKMIALRAQMEDLTKRVDQETANLLELNQKMVQYRVLKKEVEATQQLYTSMLSRAKEAGVSEKLQAPSISIIDSARPAESPIRPKKMRTILVSIVIALFGGISVIMFLEYLDSTIRTAEEVRVYLDMPFLGYIPTVTERDVAKDVDKNLICYETQQSSTAEAYRTIRTSILFASPEDRPLKSILITSALPQEGKTFAASNLSLIFSQLNERVVLLDLDMRRPKLHKSFGLKQASGLSEYLTGNADLKTILNPTFADRLSVITAGTIPPNPSELLTSAKIKTLFSELTAKFDRIIIDSPPLLIVPDSSLLANMVDGAILLIKGGGTHLQAVTHAKDKVIQAKGRLIGAIINNLEVEKEDYYYYHYYYYKEKDKDQDQGDKSKLPQKEEAPPPPSPTQKR